VSCRVSACVIGTLVALAAAEGFAAEPAAYWAELAQVHARYHHTELAIPLLKRAVAEATDGTPAPALAVVAGERSDGQRAEAAGSRLAADAGAQRGMAVPPASDSPLGPVLRGDRTGWQGDRGLPAGCVELSAGVPAQDRAAAARRHGKGRSRYGCARGALRGPAEGEARRPRASGAAGRAAGVHRRAGAGGATASGAARGIAG